MRLPKYMPLVVQQMEGSPKKPGVHHVTVLHDDWCALLKDPPGECDCEPELQAPDDAS